MFKLHLVDSNKKPTWTLRMETARGCPKSLDILRISRRDNGSNIRIPWTNANLAHSLCRISHLCFRATWRDQVTKTTHPDLFSFIKETRINVHALNFIHSVATLSMSIPFNPAIAISITSYSLFVYRDSNFQRMRARTDFLILNHFTVMELST